MESRKVINPCFVSDKPQSISIKHRYPNGRWFSFFKCVPRISTGGKISFINSFFFTFKYIANYMLFSCICTCIKEINILVFLGDNIKILFGKYLILNIYCMTNTFAETIVR